MTESKISPGTGGSDPSATGVAGKVGLWTAVAVVVGNMIGTGVYLSLGFQVQALPSGFHVVTLWILGGVISLCGALCYAELASALPQSGGEYHFLSRIYHPGVGFLSGWLSLVAGFTGPVAVAALAFGSYLTGSVPAIAEWGLSPRMLAVALIAGVALIHSISLLASSRFHGVFTLLKVALILAIIFGGFFLVGRPQPVRWAPEAADWRLLWSNPFFNSLYFVLYSYSGWNAACYIAGEVRNASRNVPLALLIGTGIVTVLYTALNCAFLRAAPVEELSGQTEVGLVAARHIFGAMGGQIVGIFICIGLVSAVSAMTWAGPRVSQRMGRDYRLLEPLGRTSAKGIPLHGVWLQSGLAIGYLFLFPSPQQMVTYVEFLLQISILLTVSGVFVLRKREPSLPRPIRAWGYPVAPGIFVLWTCVALGWMMRLQPTDDESASPAAKGLVVLAAGAALYWLCAAENKSVRARNT